MKLAALGILPLVVACSSQSRPNTRIADAEIILRHSGSPQVGTYESKPEGFSTRSYWIEGPTGLVLIDTQFLLSAAQEAVDWAERTTGKKVVLAVVLHPNPDKFNGTGALRTRGIRVITSAQVASLIPSVHADRYRSFFKRFQPDYPAEYTLPEVFGDRSTEIEAAGLKLKLHVLGAGASAAHVVVEWNKHVFTGDLVAHLGHAWLELGLVNEWLARLNDIWAMEPEHVHPGRGPSGSDELLERQEAYLRRALALMRKHAREPKAVEKVRALLENEYIGYSNPFFLTVGLPEVQARIRAGKL